MYCRSFVAKVSSLLLWSLSSQLSCLVTCSTTPVANSGAPSPFLDKFASTAAALQLFSGVVRVTNKDSVFLKAYGAESLESGSLLQKDAIMPVGSNTKLFTAVAVHQLIEAGAIGWEDPISTYMRPTDFNRTEAYSPCVHAPAMPPGEDASCNVPTVRQLLGMSSGIIDVVNCPRSPWESENGHCLQTNNYQYPFNLTEFRRMAEGDLPPAFWLFVAGMYDAPLRFVPGSEFDYSNTNFILAAYIVEVVSRMPFPEYISRYVLEPAQLQQTVYDPSFGFKGIQKGTLQGSGNIIKFAGPEQGSEAGSETMQDEAMQKVAGQPGPQFQPSARLLMSPRLEATDADAADTAEHGANVHSEMTLESSIHGGSEGNDQPELLVMRSAKRALQLSGEGSTAGGAGAMQSSASDLTKWYQTILERPHVLNLSTAAVERILAPTTQIGRVAWYGQGVFVMPAEGFPFNTSLVYHPGTIWGYRSLMAVKVDRQNVSHSRSMAILANRAVETQPPEGAGRVCVVEDKALGIGLPVPCGDVQSFLLGEMLQLGLGFPGNEALLQAEDLQQVKPCHWNRESS